MGKVLGQQQTAAVDTKAPHLAIEGHHVPGPGHHSMVWEEEIPGQLSWASYACCPGSPEPTGTPGWPEPLWPVSFWAAPPGGGVYPQLFSPQPQLSTLK